MREGRLERVALLTSLVLFLGCQIGLSQPTGTPEMTLRRAIEHHRVPSQVYTSSIQITEPGGEIKSRRSRTSLQLAEDGSFHVRIEYLSPPEIRGMIFRVTKRSGDAGLDSQIFLPSVNRWLPTTPRTLENIPAAGLIEHLWVLLDLDQSQFLLRGAGRLNNRLCRIISVSPLTESASERPAIARQLIWLSDDTLHPLQIKGFTTSNELSFTVRFEELEPLPRLPALRANRTVIIDHISGRRTEALIERDAAGERSGGVRPDHGPTTPEPPPKQSPSPAP